MNQCFDLGKSFTLSLALNFGLEHLSDFLLPFFSGHTLLFFLLVRAPTPFASTSTLRGGGGEGGLEVWDPPNPTQFRLSAAQTSAKPAANFVPFRPAKPVGRERG